MNWITCSKDLEQGIDSCVIVHFYCIMSFVKISYKTVIMLQITAYLYPFLGGRVRKSAVLELLDLYETFQTFTKLCFNQID